MSTKIKAKKASLKSHLMPMISMALIAAIALGGATYAWFTFVSNPEIRDIDLYVKAADNILLSASTKDMSVQANLENANLWYATLVQREGTPVVDSNAIESNQKWAFPAILSDVSSVFTAANRNFFARKNTDAGDFIEYLAAKAPVIPAAEGDVAKTGDYATFDVWIKSTSDGAIYLDGADLVKSYVKAKADPVSGGADLTTEPDKYLENTVRVGFYTQEDGLGAARSVIWEPNATPHLPGIYGGPSTAGKLTTNAIDQPYTAIQIPAIDPDTVGIAQTTYDFGTGTTNIAATEAAYQDTRIALFDLKADEAVKFTICIWVEGADADTRNAVANNWFGTKLRFGQWEGNKTMAAISTP